MENRVAEFKKVSFKQFKEDWIDTFPCTTDEVISGIYENLKLPLRATSGSAGYDFFSPISFTLRPSETIKIPTGIRCKIDNGWVLLGLPRSGHGFKYRVRLNNTVAVIDEDYFYSDNEGHIFIKITNDSNENKTLTVNQGEGFAQGIFTIYGLTIDDHATTKRNGGFGSTSK